MPNKQVKLHIWQTTPTTKTTTLLWLHYKQANKQQPQAPPQPQLAVSQSGPRQLRLKGAKNRMLLLPQDIYLYVKNTRLLWRVGGVARAQKELLRDAESLKS